MKLANLFEAKTIIRRPEPATEEKDLIGLHISGKMITAKTKDEDWFNTFDCSINNLTSLKGAPSYVGNKFICSNNKLTSLEFAPEHINGHLDCAINNITSLEGIHKIIKAINGEFYAYNNPLKSHVLGLLLIKGVKRVIIDNIQVQKILNKHLPNEIGNKGVLACQNDLLDADLDDFAQL